MTFGSITQQIDLPEVALVVFFLLFAGLVWHLRRRDKLEGYPMQASPFDQTPLLGFPAPPPREVYLLQEGGATVTPHFYPPTPIQARPLYPFGGTPLVPVGNPLLAAIGPGAWVNRTDRPMLTENGELMLQPLRLCDDWRVEEGEADPRGMTVFDWRWTEVGVVADLWVDRSIKILRLLEVELNAGLGRGRVLVPIFHADIREGAREVRVTSLRWHQFADVPMPSAPDRISAREEERLNAYYAAGRFYRDSPLTEPPGAAS